MSTTTKISAHDVGISEGEAIAAERIQQGVLRLYVDQARDAVRYGHGGETDFATEILALSERLTDPCTDASAGLLAEDCDAIDAALAEAGYDPRDPEIRREAQDAAAASCAADLSIALDAIADEIRSMAAGHLSGIEGGPRGAAADFAAGADERAACGLSDEGWEIPATLARCGVIGADLDQAVIAAVRAIGGAQ